MWRQQVLTMNHNLIRLPHGTLYSPAPLNLRFLSVVLESVMFHAASGLNYDLMPKLVASTSFHWSCDYQNILRLGLWF